ncbi:hypothetical protein ES703_77262 [subsurface metagenome]
MKTQVILKNLQWLGRHNPAFTPGSVQTAVAELLNPTSSILPYSARLCLDKPAIVCTGTIFFNIDAGKTKNVNFQILMPTAEGTYPVHLDIFSNDQLLEAYQAAEDVVIAKGPITPPGEVKLKRGGNFVVYTGRVQSANNALASIISYIDPKKVIYRWNNTNGLYEQVITTSTMVPYGVYWIEVTQDCTWTYGAAETPLTVVPLIAGRTNIVPYCGRAIPPKDAFASILKLLDTGYWVGYFNNVTKEYDSVAFLRSGVWVYPQSLMVPYGAYFIRVWSSGYWWF